MGKMFFNILATFAEFESDLLKMRTREGMKIARAKGKLRGLIRRCYGVDGTFVIHWSSKDQPSEGEPSPYSIKVHDLDRSSTGWNP